MQKRSSYDRAYEVCLQGRGYTVASTFGGMPPAPAPAPATLPSAAAGTPTTVAPWPTITEQKVPPPACAAAPSLQTIEQKLKDPKSVLDQGLITQTDYEAEKGTASSMLVTPRSCLFEELISLDRPAGQRLALRHLL